MWTPVDAELEGQRVARVIATEACLQDPPVSRSHKGAAGMRSVLTFVKVVWIVDARVER
jgi:hypothetical protein